MKNKKLLLIFLATLLFRLILAPIVWHPDVRNHADWGIRFWQYGPSKFYAANVWNYTWPNQPPGTMYMFAGVRKAYEWSFQFLSFLHFQVHVFPGSFLLYLEQNMYPAFLKLPAIAADLGIAWLIGKVLYDLTKKKNLAIIGASVWLFNPAVWYNSAVWGQYDAVINFLAMLAFYLLSKKKLIWAVILFAVSLYIKASLLIFGPVFLIFALGQKYSFKKWVIALAVSFLIIVLITLPFSHGNPINWLYLLYKDKVFTQQLQIITANAFNIWAAITGISEQPQTLPFLGWTYQYWSYILFSLFYIPALFLVYKKQDIKSLVWSLAIAAFTSFMLLTNMHERYLYPLFPYFTILLILDWRLFANYIGVSLINVLNLYNFWWTPKIIGLVNAMGWQNGLLPRIIGGANFLLFTFLYLRFVRYILEYGKMAKATA